MRNATLCFPRALLLRAIDGGPIRPSSGRQFLVPGHDDAVLADLLVERAARNAKRFRRAADPSALGLERLADQVLLRQPTPRRSRARRKIPQARPPARAIRERRARARCAARGCYPAIDERGAY